MFQYLGELPGIGAAASLGTVTDSREWDETWRHIRPSTPIQWRRCRKNNWQGRQGSVE